MIGAVGCGFQPVSTQTAHDDAATDAANDSPMTKSDADIDAPLEPEWTAIETLIVAADGTEVKSVTVLATGVEYRLRATGTWVIQNNVNPKTEADAEWWDFANPVTNAGGVDVGLAINDADVDGSRQPDWGAYNASHEYEVTWMGAGEQIVANIHDGNFSNDEGSLSLTILTLQ
ncbi:MAG: hypothetical protein AB7O24_13575 [Kofleriaceae bacterium]